MDTNDFWYVDVAAADGEQAATRHHSTFPQATRDALDHLEAGYWVRMGRVIEE